MAWKFNAFTGKLDYYESGTGGAVEEAPINGTKYARKDGGWVTFSEAGSPAWGSITGTLSNQTDLQTALNNKANALGADDNYVTDAEKIVIGNTSGTNTGDNAVNSLYSGLASSKLDANTPIVGATKTKITYDADGLVTAGADATTADIADSLNKRYVTDANLTTIGNQSGTNTGDNATNTQYSGLATSKQDTLVSGTNIKTINGSSVLGSGDLVISGVSDGDKGDITVSGSGATWTIDNGVVTLAKQADMATASVVYRKTAGVGAPEVQTLATLKTDLGLTGTNTGDQTTIVGITGTKAQFDTAVTDGNFLFVGDVTSNATHTGDVTGSGALTIDPTAITGKTLVTAVGTDYVLVSDTSDAGNLKKALISDFSGAAANTFGTIAVSGQSDVVADSTTDTLTLAAGTNITITTNATTDTITINSTGGGSGITLGAAIATSVGFNMV